jgi:hypothetical protein
METTDRMEQFEARLSRVEAEIGLHTDKTSPDGGPGHEVTRAQRIFAKLDGVAHELRTLATFTEVSSSVATRIDTAMDGVTFRLGELEEGQGRVLELLRQHGETLTEIRECLTVLQNAA